MSDRHIEDGMGFAGLVGGGCRDCASYEKEIERLKAAEWRLEQSLTICGQDLSKARALLDEGATTLESLRSRTGTHTEVDEWISKVRGNN